VSNAFRNIGSDPEVAKAAGKMVDDLNNTLNVETEKAQAELDSLIRSRIPDTSSGYPANVSMGQEPDAALDARQKYLSDRIKQLTDAKISVEEVDKAVQMVSDTLDTASRNAEKAFTTWYDGTSKAAQGSVTLQKAMDWQLTSDSLLERAEKNGTYKAVKKQVDLVTESYKKQTNALKSNEDGVNNSWKNWKQNKIELDSFSLSQRDMLADMVKGNATIKQATDAYSLARGEIVATSLSYGAGTTQAEAYADAILGTPEEFQTVLKLDDQAAKLSLNTDLALLAALTGNVYTFDVKGNILINGKPFDPDNPNSLLGKDPTGKPFEQDIPLNYNVKPTYTVGLADGSTTNPSTAMPNLATSGVIPNLSASLGVGMPGGKPVPQTVEVPVNVKAVPTVVGAPADGTYGKGLGVLKPEVLAALKPPTPPTVDFPYNLNPIPQFPGGGGAFTVPPLTPPPPVPITADTSSFDSAVSSATSSGTTFSGQTFKATIDADSSGAVSAANAASSAINGVQGKTVYIDVITRETKASASGGYISGPGTGTSDSIPARLSNGEYVIRASSVSKYGRGMLDNINAQRFAKGGSVKKLSKKAKEALKSELEGMGSSLGGFYSTSDTAEDILKDLRDTIKKRMSGKTERAMLKSLTSLDKKASKLNAIQEQVAKAQDVLEKRKADKSEFQEGIRGAVRPDISQFGQTKGGIKAGLSTQVGQAKKFISAIQKLKKAGFPQGLIQQVVGLGLTDGLAAANQLLALPAADRQAVIGDFKFLDSFAEQYAVKLGDAYYDAGIKAAQATVDRLTAQQREMNKVFEKAADAFIEQLVSKLGLNPKKKKKKATHDAGGFLETGTSLVVNNTGQPEPVLTADQWRSIQRLVNDPGRGRIGAPMIGTAVIRENVDLARYERQRAFRERSTRV